MNVTSASSESVAGVEPVSPSIAVAVMTLLWVSPTSPARVALIVQVKVAPAAIGACGSSLHDVAVAPPVRFASGPSRSPNRLSSNAVIVTASSG